MVTSLVGVINAFSDLTDRKAVQIGFCTGYVLELRCLG
jgi:hypothetical protein